MSKKKRTKGPKNEDVSLRYIYHHPHYEKQYNCYESEYKDCLHWEVLRHKEIKEKDPMFHVAKARAYLKIAQVYINKCSSACFDAFCLDTENPYLYDVLAQVYRFENRPHMALYYRAKALMYRGHYEEAYVCIQIVQRDYYGSFFEIEKDHPLKGTIVGDFKNFLEISEFLKKKIEDKKSEGLLL